VSPRHKEVVCGPLGRDTSAVVAASPGRIAQPSDRTHRVHAHEL